MSTYNLKGHDDHNSIDWVISEVWIEDRACDKAYTTSNDQQAHKVQRVSKEGGGIHIDIKQFEQVNHEIHTKLWCIQIGTI